MIFRFCQTLSEKILNIFIFRLFLSFAHLVLAYITAYICGKAESLEVNVNEYSEYSEYRILAEDGKTIYRALYRLPEMLSKQAEERVLLIGKAFFERIRSECGMRTLALYLRSEDRLKRIHMPPITALMTVDRRMDGTCREEVLLKFSVKKGTRVVHFFEKRLVFDEKEKLFVPEGT